MKSIQNPFLQRTAEQAAEFEFLSLFSPIPLEVIKGSGLLANKFIRSSPGGGKTTILRLFTPGILSKLHSARTEFKELYSVLREFEAVDDNGVLVSGVYQSCVKTYADISNVGLNPISGESLFFRLLNARILLTAIDGLRDLLNINSRDEVHDLRCTFSDYRIPLVSERDFSSVGMVFRWAAGEETAVCDILDSFKQSEMSHSTISANKLFSLDMLSAMSVIYQGEAHTWKHFLMLDDVQWLHPIQRRSLINAITRERHGTKVWVSERLDSLALQELAHAGDRPSRDFDSIYLEDHWKTPRGRHAFSSMLRGIADRRARAFRDRVIESFSNRLEESLDVRRYNVKFQKIEEKLSASIRDSASGMEKYKEWIATASSRGLTPHERAVHWASMGILLARDSRRPQLEMDFAIDAERLEEKIGSDIKAAASLFLAKEYKYPYYFGFSALVALATCNVDQFLFIASRLFDEISTIQLMRGEAGLLSADRQHELIIESIVAWRTSILNGARHGPELLRLISHISKFCTQRTFEPNAPYAPGVTGVALLMGDWDQLCEIGEDTNHQYYKLASVLRSALTNNLLTSQLHYPCKGNYWAVLYLNRALCAAVHLPLQYGGWKEWSLSDFARTFDNNPRRKAGPTQDVLFE